MLAFERVTRLDPRGLEGSARHHLDVVSVGPGGGQEVRYEVDLVRSTKTIPAQAQILLDEFTAYGTAATVQERLDRWDATVDITVVGLPPGLPWPQIEATVRAAAPAVVRSA